MAKPDSPEMTVRAFVKALNERDVATVLSLVAESKPSEELTQFLARMDKGDFQFSIQNLRIQNDGSATMATANLKTRIAGTLSTGDSRNDNVTSRLQLRRFGQQWKIVAPTKWQPTGSDYLQWMIQTVAPLSWDEVKAWAKGRGQATLTGRLVDENNQPVPNVKVSAQMLWQDVKQIPGAPDEQNSYGWKSALPPDVLPLLGHSAITDANGIYRISGLTSAKYTVLVWPYVRIARFEADDKLPERVPLSRHDVAAQEKQSITVPSIGMTRGAVIDVSIVDKTTGQPLPEVFVSISRQGANSGEQQFSYSLDTDGNGNARFRVPSAKVQVGIGGNFLPNNHTLVTRSAGKTYAIDIAGAIVDGKPAAKSGSVAFDVKTGQTHTVVFRLQPYVAPTPTPTPIPRPLPRGAAVLTGRVVYANGQAAPNVQVTATMQQKERWAIFKGIGLAYGHFDEEPERTIWEKTQGVFTAFATTNEQGIYRFNGLTTAPYNLTIGSSRLKGSAPADWVAAAHEGVWAKEGEARQRTRELVLTRGALIEGRIVDAIKNVPVGGNVTLAFNGPSFPASADGAIFIDSDSTGTFFAARAAWHDFALCGWPIQ